MPIYTKFGDTGETSLLGSGKVSKDDDRVEAYGSVDELNSVLGIVISFSEKTDVTDSLKKIQRDLFIIGAELASNDAKTKSLPPTRISELEEEIDMLEKEMPPLKNFILPGGSKTASLLHHARTVCRRAERRIVTATKNDLTNITYLNRLGDLLFMLARYVNYKKKVDEIVWRGR